MQLFGFTCDNVTTTQRASNSHFFHNKWAMLMLMRISLPEFECTYLFCSRDH